MPLAFESANHGEVAFGFFNVDGDMLLLERTFFGADEFCGAVSRLAGARADAAWEMTMPGWVIERADDVGDLMGAIHGIRHTGFIGDVYRRFPFPVRPEDFRQKTRGFETRDEFRRLIEPWGREEEVSLAVEPDGREVRIGRIRFRREVFLELVRYVWRGGWPRWQGGVRPAYVDAMGAAVAAGENPAVSGLVLGE